MSDHAIRLLLVEDNPAYARLVSELLKEGSTTVRFDTAITNSLASALNHLREMNCDAILLDLGLPDSQGLDSLTSIFSNYPRIPILVLTALEDEENAVKAVASGAQDYLLKGHIEGAALVRSIMYAIERKKSEGALSRVAKKYSDMINTMFDVVFTLDFDGTVVDIDPKMERIIGWTQKESIGKQFSEFVHADDLPIAEAEFIRAIQGIGRPIEIRVVHKDNTFRWVRINALLITKDGEPEELSCVLSDITEKKADELLLAVQSDILNVLSRSSNIDETLDRIVGIIKATTEFDAVGIRLQTGDDYPFVASVGYSDEFLQAENTLAMQYPQGGICRDKDGNVSLECTCGLLISGKTDPANPLFTAGGSAWTNDSLPFLDVPLEQDPRLHPRNRCIHIGFRSLALVPLRAGNKIIGLIHLASHRTDLFTEKSIKFWEGIGVSMGVAILRNRAEEATQEANTNLEAIFESSPTPIFILDEKINVVMINSAAVLLTGGSISDALHHRPGNALRCVHSSEDPRGCGHSTACPFCPVRNGIESLIANGGSMHSAELVMDLVRNGTTQKVWLSIGAEPIHIGGRLHLCVAMDDVTERKRVEEELKTDRANLERIVANRTSELKLSNEELESFVYSVSHDLRAPLRSIDGFSQAVMEDYADKLDAKGQDYLNLIRDSTQRMGKLIDEMLMLSRISRAELKLDPVNLSSIAEKISRDLEGSQPGRNVEFIIKPHIEVKGDRDMMRILMENLIGNAWKYTSKHESARIEVGTGNGIEGESFYVKDDGAGFDMKYVDKLFTPFQRLHSTSEFPGTGVGLATVKRILNKHGGKIWAEGAVEKGAIFHFTIGSEESIHANVRM